MANIGLGGFEEVGDKILRFDNTDESKKFEDEVQKSILIRDEFEWGLERLMKSAHYLDESFNWVIKEVSEGIFSIEGPTIWKNKVIADQSIFMGGKILKVEPPIHIGEVGNRLNSVWLRVQNFPVKFWYKAGFDKLVEDCY